jgi:integrative and conjugative element protein (TIGR02256 family)
MTITHYRLAEKALAYILEESERMYPQETGGILIGRFEQNCVSIEYAIAPGPDASHTVSGFKRDGNYSQDMLDSIVASSGGQVDYIGEWHSHPVASGPSLKDIMAMRWIINNKKYAIRCPVMGLCMKEDTGSWQVRLYLHYQLKLNELIEVDSNPSGS